MGEVGGGESLDDEDVAEGGGKQEDRFEEAGTMRAGGEQKGELDGDGDEGLMRFEGEAEGGEQDEGDAPGQGKRFAGEVRGGGEEVREHEEDEDVVALAEVAGGEDAGDDEKEEGEEPAVGQGALAEVGEAGAEQGAEAGEQGDGELEGDRQREMEEVSEQDEEGGEPEGEGWVGFKDKGSVGVGMRADPGGGKEKPELIVSGVG